MPNQAGKRAAEEAVELITGKGFDHCTAATAFNCANIDDCLKNRDAIAAIFERYMEEKRKALVEWLRAKLATVDERITWNSEPSRFDRDDRLNILTGQATVIENIIRYLEEETVP